MKNSKRNLLKIPSENFPSNVLIAGCGYLGRAVASRLFERAKELHRSVQMYGVCRSVASLERLKGLGIHGVRADLGSLGELRAALKALPRMDAVVACQSPSKGENYLRTYYRVTANVLEAVGSARFVFVSSTSVYGDAAGAWVNEWMPVEVERLSTDTRVLAQTEAMVRHAGGMVLRLGGLYGPERHRAMRVAANSVRLGPPDSWMNRIHRDDAARAVVTLIERGGKGSVYTGVDDEPTTQKIFYAWIYEKLGMTLPEWKSEDVDRPHKRCSNLKLRALGWKPEYPTFREGYAALVEKIS